MNIAIIRGRLSSPPRHRSLPSGSELITYEVSTGSSDGPRLTVPVAWFEPSRPPNVDVGDEVVAVGVVRRRYFSTGAGTQSRTEIAATAVARPESARASKALSAASEALASGL